MQNKIHFSRLKWASRRGMLELDVLLINFLNEIYPTLHQEKQLLFQHLLNFEDQLLFAWLMGLESPKEPALAEIVKTIRNHARSRIRT